MLKDVATSMGKSNEKGFVETYGHITTWGIGVVCLFGALWVQVNFPSRNEFRETTKEMLNKIDQVVRSLNEAGIQLAIVKDRQDLQTVRIIDMDKRLKTIEIRFPGPIPTPGE